jgi:maltooligosyltrehalose trehalohydrolase
MNPTSPYFGPRILDEGVHFALWAPYQPCVSLVIEGHAALKMLPSNDGWHQIMLTSARPGTRYRFELADGRRVPDPASRFQPEDVHGPSEVIDPTEYIWTTKGWRGRPWREAVIYELHIGSFTLQGTFRGAIERLDHLARLGVTAIEIMPVADFPGARNWGYDGVLLYAPDSSYGRPSEFKEFVDAAHARGIMVFLDVVYNHFGPDGNFLPLYAPIFTERHKTPWGAAVNYDAEGSPAVREFVIQNAIYWIDEFRLDGLRLDAVHAIKDDNDPHLLDELAARVRAAAPDRIIHLLLENEENSAEPLMRREDGEPKYFTAQWNDDVHHVLHTALTGETAGYYADYVGDTGRLGRALAEGFAYQGDMMPYRGSPRGEPSAHLPPLAFVSFLQNHDQVGNRAFGDRLVSLAPHEAVRAAAAVYLLMPQIPMLFMGEECGAQQPFLFFCDFEPQLAEAVRTGRRNEFAKFPQFQDPAQRTRIPDPTAAETFLSSKLDWSMLDRTVHREWHDYYSALIAIRHSEIIPLLESIGGQSAQYTILGHMAVRVTWQSAGGALVLVANLKPAEQPVASQPVGRRLWSNFAGGELSLPSWAVSWTIEGQQRNGQEDLA